MWMISLLIISLSLIIFLCSAWIWSLHQSKENVLYDKPTMFDVRDCIIRGDKLQAVRLYAQIFKSSSRDAKRGVEQLEKSIQEKNFDLE